MVILLLLGYNKPVLVTNNVAIIVIINHGRTVAVARPPGLTVVGTAMSEFVRFHAMAEAMNDEW